MLPGPSNQQTKCDLSGQKMNFHCVNYRFHEDWVSMRYLSALGLYCKHDNIDITFSLCTGVSPHGAMVTNQIQGRRKPRTLNKLKLTRALFGSTNICLRAQMTLTTI